ncbi:MAG: hypothetical protein ABW036_03635 [Flavitalea sp.]
MRPAAIEIREKKVSDEYTNLRNRQQNLIATCTLFKKMIESATREDKPQLEKQLALVEEQLVKINDQFNERH